MSTLVSEPFLEDIPRFLGMSLDELRARKSPEAHVAFEKGLIDEGEYARRFFLDDTRLDIDGLKATLRASVRLLPGVEEALARAAREGVSMYALSNYSEWYRVIDEATGLSRYIDWAFVSCRTGVRKPDREAYLRPARVLGVAPEACLFVDDREKNVAAARDVGMPALLRTPGLDLEAALVSRGVLGG
jgi:HAD superfamily hydrolase (TIGR01509 family)